MPTPGREWSVSIYTHSLSIFVIGREDSVFFLPGFASGHGPGGHLALNTGLWNIPRLSFFGPAQLSSLAPCLVAFCIIPLFSVHRATGDPLRPSSRQLGHPGYTASASIPTVSNYASLLRPPPVFQGTRRLPAVAPLLLTIVTESGRATSVEPAVLGSTGQPQIGSGSSQVDFGTISTLVQPQSSKTVFLRNDNKAPVTISSLQPSCGCLSASLLEALSVKASGAPSRDGSPSSRLPLSAKLPQTQGRLEMQGGPALDGSMALHHVLPAGQQVPLHIVLHDAAMAPGAVAQSVLVFLEGQTAPAADLRVTGQVQPDIRFSPRTLDFGRVSAKDDHFLLLHVTLNAQLIASGMNPQVACSDPNIRVDLMPVSLTEGSASLPNHAPNHDFFEQTYRLRLSPNVPVGRLNGRIYLTLCPKPGSAVENTLIGNNLNSKAAPSDTVPGERGQAVAVPATVPNPVALVIVPVAGEVVRGVSGSPEIVVPSPRSQPGVNS